MYLGGLERRVPLERLSIQLPFRLLYTTIYVHLRSFIFIIAK